MSKHSEAFKAFLTLKKYCKNRICHNCCFSIYNDSYCPFDANFLCPKYFVVDNEELEEISNKIHFLEQQEMK